jgi:Reverse transcriptase (RNA-dependent DNA polymerase)
LQLTLEDAVLSRLDLTQAVTDELEYEPPYLPRTPIRRALETRIPDVVALLKGRYRKGFEVDESEVVQVAKKGGGLRPVRVVDFQSRVLYRALCASVEDGLPTVDRSHQRKRELERAPLDVDGVQYVVIGDVAAFYDAVDHGRLAQEVVAQTGDAEIAEALSAFLHHLMGRRFGLPQVLHASDVLSETYIDIAERGLLRQELDVSRFNDDFWIAALDWRHAREAVEALDREVRSLGLTLNELKTFPLRADVYSSWLDQPEERWNELNAEVEIDLRSVGPYSEEPPDLELAEQEVVTEAAGRALEIAVEEDAKDRLQEEVNRQLVAAAVGALEFFASPAGLPSLERVLIKDPQLTHRVARYLSAIAPGEAQEVTGVFEQVISSPAIYLSEWQAMWLFEPLRRLPSLTPHVIDWVRNYLAHGRGELVRARAAVVLAEKAEIEASALAEVYGTVRNATRPEVVWAISRALPPQDKLRRAVAREDPINRWVMELACA